MINYVMNLPIALSGTVVIVFSIVGSLFGLWLTHRYLDLETLRKTHDVGGFIYAVITMAYAVILAFVVIVVWENFHDAEKVCQEESNAVGDMRRYSEVFPDSVRLPINSTTLDYMNGVVQKEWISMDSGKENLEVRADLLKLWRIYKHFKPTDPQHVQYLELSLGKMAEMNDKRRLRLLVSRSSLPTIMWVMLLGGSFLSIAFSFLFASPVRWVQMVMTAALSGMFGLSLFLIFALDHPFSGDVRVQPEAFMYLIDRAAKDPPQ